MNKDYLHFYQKICASNLPASAINVYKAILRYADYTNWSCYPSVRTIARDTNLSERTVRRQLSILVESGYLLRIPRRRENNGHTSNMYFFN
ncbi:helix-turn-helix domain-containing protein [Amedibacillus sp. YH-ame10]